MKDDERITADIRKTIERMDSIHSEDHWMAIGLFVFFLVSQILMWHTAQHAEAKALPVKCETLSKP